MEEFTPERIAELRLNHQLTYPENLNNPSFIRSIIQLNRPEIVGVLLAFIAEGYPDYMVQRFTYVFEVIRQLGISYRPEDYVFEPTLSYLLVEYSNIQTGKNPEVLKSIELLVKYGIGVNGELSTEEEPIPIFIAAERYRNYELMQFIMNQPEFILRPEYLTMINQDLEPLDSIREEFITRLRGGIRSNKRSRYELD